MDLLAPLRDLLAEQHGVVSRRQALAADLDDAILGRAVRRRELCRVVEGIYVAHTGPLTWGQRAWVAVLYYAPAALAGYSCLRAEGLRRVGPENAPIQVAVDHSRRVGPIDGVVPQRKRGLELVVHPSRQPPRLRLEEALLDEASAARTDDEAIALLADAVQQRRTTPRRLVDQLAGRPRLRRRALLLAVFEDVAEGAYSLLEHRYLTRVERPHGLPTAKRQRHVRLGRSAGYRDVEYVGLATIVELDGRLGHEDTSDRWDDLDRDIAGIVGGSTTLRAGWRHVLSPCRLAAAVGAVLVAQGWTGAIRPCSPTCAAGAAGIGPPTPTSPTTPPTPPTPPTGESVPHLVKGSLPKLDPPEPRPA